MTRPRARENEVVQDGPHRGLVLPLASAGMKRRYRGTEELPSGRWRAYVQNSDGLLPAPPRREDGGR